MAQNKLTLAAGLFAGALLAAGQANAGVVEDHRVNFSNADAALPDATDVWEWTITGRSQVVTRGSTTSLQAPGGEFYDNVAIRFTGFNDFNSNNETPASYGNGAGDTFELTAIGTLEGQNTSVTGDEVEFDFTSGSLGVYLDSANLNGGGAYTPSDFTDLSTFDDGMKVEDLTLISSLFGQTSDGDFDFEEQDGRTDPKFQQTQLVEDFVTDADDTGRLNFLLADTNNEENPNAAIESSFQSYFSGTQGNGNDSLLATNDGSSKKAVPTPTTVGLLGIGLVALGGGLSRRRKKAAADL